MQSGPALALPAPRSSVVLLDESASPQRLLCITLILAGVIGLKLVSEA